MNLVLNEMHDMLRRSARDFLEQECPKSLVRFCENEPSGYAPELWGKMARQGWLSMVLPTEYGGTNSAFMDVCVLYEEMGRAIVPGPFADVVLSEYLLLDLANAEQQRRYLPGLGSGNLIATIAYTEPTASYDAHAIQLSARQEEERYVLSGAKLFVPNAHIADVLLVVARTGRYVNPQDGLTVFLVDRNAPGVEITVLDTIGSDRQCEVLFNDVTVAQSSVLGTVDNAWPAPQALPRPRQGDDQRVVGRRRLLRARDHGGLRQKPGAVWPAHRQFPGRGPQVRRHLDSLRRHALRRLPCRLAAR